MPKSYKNLFYFLLLFCSLDIRLNDLGEILNKYKITIIKKYSERNTNDFRDEKINTFTLDSKIFASYFKPSISRCQPQKPNAIRLFFLHKTKTNET